MEGVLYGLVTETNEWKDHVRHVKEQCNGSSQPAVKQEREVDASSAAAEAAAAECQHWEKMLQDMQEWELEETDWVDLETIVTAKHQELGALAARAQAATKEAALWKKWFLEGHGRQAELEQRVADLEQQLRAAQERVVFGAEQLSALYADVEAEGEQTREHDRRRQSLQGKLAVAEATIEGLRGQTKPRVLTTEASTQWHVKTAAASTQTMELTHEMKEVQMECAEYAQLERKLQRKTQEAELLDQQVAHLLPKLREEEEARALTCADLNQKTREVEDTLSNLRSKQKQCEDLEEELAKLRWKVREERELSAQAASDLKQKQVQCQDVEDELGRLRAQFREAQEAWEEKSRQRQRECEALEDELAKLRARLREEVESKESAMAELKGKRQECHDLEEELKQLRKKLRQDQEGLAGLKGLQMRCEHLEEELARLTSKLKEQQEAKEKAMVDLKGKRQECIHHEEDFAKLKTKLVEEQQVSVHLQEELARLRGMQEDSPQTKALEAELAQQQARLQEHTQAKEGMQVDLENKLAKLCAKLQEMIQEREALSINLKESQKQCKYLEQEVARLMYLQQGMAKLGAPLQQGEGNNLELTQLRLALREAEVASKAAAAENQLWDQLYTKLQQQRQQDLDELAQLRLQVQQADVNRRQAQLRLPNPLQPTSLHTDATRRGMATVVNPNSSCSVANSSYHPPQSPHGTPHGTRTPQNSSVAVSSPSHQRSLAPQPSSPNYDDALLMYSKHE